jgi:hypothetical protein
MKLPSKALASVLLAASLAPLLSTQLGAQAAANRPLAPLLVDKSGRVIGPLAMSPPGSYGSVLINVDNEALVFNLYYDLDRNGVLASNGVTWQASGPLVYASGDCSGQPHVGFGNLGSRRPVAVLRQDGKWLAYVGGAGAAQQLVAHSYLQADGTCVPANAQRSAVAVAYVLQLDAFGSPPFYVR